MIPHISETDSPIYEQAKSQRQPQVCISLEYGYGTVGFDVETNRRLGILFPWLTGDHWLCLGPTGHYRGSPGVEDQIVYVAMLPDGSQRTYTPAEFAKTFGWQNDPEKAELLGK